MSRRESCVWHPMPEEVRRSSVQSRRASLAAGRRKSATNEPDWEVEAPPTPPKEDHEPVAQQQQEPEAAAPAAAAAAAAPAAAAAAAEPAAPAAAEPQQQTRELQPEPEAAPAAAEPAAAAQEEKKEAEPAPAAAAAAEPEPAAEKKEEAAAAPAAAPAAAEEKKMRTRHTVRFRGADWGAVKSRKAQALHDAFLADIQAAAGISAEQASGLEFSVSDAMVVTFVSTHPVSEKAKQAEIHAKLRDYDFPKVCALYVGSDAAGNDGRDEL